MIDGISADVARVDRDLKQMLATACDRIAALEAERERLRLERDEARVAACRLRAYGQAVADARSNEGAFLARDAWRGMVQAVRGMHAWLS